MDSSFKITQIIRDIITHYGPPTESNQRMYSGLMMDLLVDYPRELNLLKIPLEQGLVFRLIKENNKTPFDILNNQLVNYLYTNVGMDTSAARWSVETWAEAIGYDISTQIVPVLMKTEDIKEITQPSLTHTDTVSSNNRISIKTFLINIGLIIIFGLIISILTILMLFISQNINPN